MFSDDAKDADDGHHFLRPVPLHRTRQPVVVVQAEEDAVLRPVHPAPRRRRAGRVVDDDNNTNTVCARSKKSHRESPRDSLREPPPQTPLEEAVEETLYDGRHVLVVLDKHGARLYRTQIASEAWKLEPLINYNHRGECSSSSIIVERGKSFSVWFCCFLSSLTKKERSDDRPVPFIVS